MLLSSVLNALHDVGHGSGAVGLKDLDGVDVGLLGDTVLLASDGTRAVSAVAVPVDILVVGWDGLAPVSTSLEINVVNVRSGVNDIDVNTLTALTRVEVLVEGGEREWLSVGDAGKTPRGVGLGLAETLLNTVGAG